MTEIKFTPAQDQWLEVTWFEVTQLPDTINPAKLALFDAEGNEVQAAQPETTTPGGTERKEVKHTSYHPTQLDMLQADAAAMGTPLDEYTDMLNAWVAAYVPPPPAPPVVPQSVAALQGLLALDAAGLGQTYDAWSTDPARTFTERAFINKAQNWRRDDPTLASAAAAFGLSDADLDALFVAAAGM